MLGVCACILGLAASVVAQDKSAPAAPSEDAKTAVTGTVSDKTGAGVKGATVTMDNGAGLTTNTTSDAEGLYAITDLPAGSYTISVVVSGAAIFQSKVELQAGQVLAMSVVAPNASPETKTSPPSSGQPPPAEAPASSAPSSTAAEPP